MIFEDYCLKGFSILSVIMDVTIPGNVFSDAACTMFTVHSFYRILFLIGSIETSLTLKRIDITFTKHLYFQLPHGFNASSPIDSLINLSDVSQTNALFVSSNMNGCNSSMF